MKFVLITGMSGAGKSKTVDVLEDMGYYCVDNMPLDFVVKFAEICKNSQGKMEKVAIVTDIRTSTSFDGVIKELLELKKTKINYEVLYLDADESAIIKRYKETRRKHPLAETHKDKRISEIITFERQALKPFYEIADNIIDTTTLSSAQLSDKILKIFGEGKKTTVVNVISFGFKYGIPSEADMVFDVRFLPNPFYEQSLKKLSGQDREIEEYVFKFSQSNEFLSKLKDMLKFLMPLFIEEGKSSVVIAIGCTGGRHRSVLFAEKINEYCKTLDVNSTVYHRDMQKFNS